MKAYYLLLGADLDFLRFPKHKTVWGKIPRLGYLHPHPVLFLRHFIGFLRLHAHKTGLGARYPGQGGLIPIHYS